LIVKNPIDSESIAYICPMFLNMGREIKNSSNGKKINKNTAEIKE